MEAHHHEEFKKMMSQHQEIEKMREERKRKGAGEWNGAKQLKLIGSNNNSIINWILKFKLGGMKLNYYAFGRKMSKFILFWLRLLERYF